MESSTTEIETKTKKSTTTTDIISTNTVIVIVVVFVFTFFCCFGISAFCFYKRKRAKQIEQISEGVPSTSPEQLNGQPAVSPVVHGQVVVVKPTKIVI
ncbi:hypothetical protein GCK72_009805 [Caenorhabditis remanei]|uniref:Uncharacterized protein n=1 Tax=Caenorhabditis remanei TaxID=31234 RepID=A0A6A5H3I8_CAERE|nr:hypothetical protein GCK72_009805 [Caenorhabditis remanei]KAF1761549.1 hypothetical protein GCK72_009805 [Caenorhabditis remanei]